MKILKSALLFIFLLAFSVVTFARPGKPKNLAYYNADSIMPLMNRFKAKNDSMSSYNLKIQATLTKMEAEYEGKLKALKADSAVVTPEYYAVRKAEVTALRQNSDAFREAAKAESVVLDSILTSYILIRIQSAAEQAIRKTKYKKVYEETVARKMAAAPGANYTLVDITDLVIKELRYNGEIR
ncbi:MAG TPA: OmpH family outer membrane protein [Bacteroidia bacterium]|nr:OmpH family outer membrane protein [Bacteroidia bacterium]